MDAVICETPRLILRRIEPSDSTSLLEILGDPEVMRFSRHGPETPGGVQKFIDATLQRYERDGVAQWAVIEKISGQFIGECGISVQRLDSEKEYEIGYKFSREHWGKGYATEAAAACRDYGLAKLNLQRLVSIIESDNERSIRVAERIGMHLEKKTVFHGIPVQIYAINKTERPSF